MQVPTDFVESVMPTGKLEPERIDINANQFGAQLGQAEQKLGAAGEQTGNMLAQHAVQRQQILNETNVNDIYSNQFSPAFRQLREEFLKLQGKDAETRFPEFEQRAQDLRTQFRDAMPNDMQRKLFDMQATHRTQIDLDGMSRYAAQETRSWELNTHKSVISDLTAEAENNYNNPQRLQDVQNRIDNQLIDYGSKHGWSSEIFQSQRRDATDNMWEAVIKRRAIAGDVTGAISTYNEQNQQGRLSGIAQGKIEQFIRPYQENMNAQKAFGMATGGPVASQITTEAQRQGFDPGTALTMWSCEGRVTDPTVKNPKSSATGHFQVLDNTWEEWGHGPADRYDSAAQISESIAAMKRDSVQFQSTYGRQPQPWEQYLMWQQGTGGAQKLLANPDASAVSIVGEKAVVNNGGTPDMTASQFTSMIKGYVSRHSQMYDPAGMPTAQNLKENYVSGLDAVKKQAQIDYPNDPLMQDKYMSFYEDHAAVVLRADHLQDQGETDAIYGKLHGPNGPKNWDDLMSDPQASAAYSRLFGKDPSIWKHVDDAIKTNAYAAWDPKPSPESESRFNELKGLAATNRDAFENMNLNPFYGSMPIAQFNHLDDMQNGLRKHDTTMEEKNISDQRMIRLTDRVLHEAPAGTAWNMVSSQSALPDKAKSYNQLISQVGQAVDQWRINNNHQIPADQTIDGIVRGIVFPGQQQTAKAAGQQAAPQKTGGTASAEAATGGEHRPNRDPFSLWVADQLQERGLSVTDGNISEMKARLLKQDPEIEKHYKDINFGEPANGAK